MRAAPIADCEAAIWTRVIEPEKNSLAPAAARSLLELGFSERDQALINELRKRTRKDG